MKRIRIITGHYGSGKSELSVNMVTELKKQYDKVAIVDLDIANPYFRSRERQDMMEDMGIEVFHNSFGYDITQDLPALSAAIKKPLENKDYHTIVDAGGDDSGARVLNQFRKYFLADDCEMIFVINANRPETSTVSGCLHHLDAIQVETGLKVDGIINNTHLLSETSAADIKKGYKLCKEVSELLDIPIIGSYCNEKILNNIKEEELDGIEVTPIHLFMRPSWLQ
ncbi:ATP-binding protein [Gallibacter intestinalis]|uniref:ATP-binding protein n=1 Tax=Gallibacter intestinalis TaxID=2779356 RepID=A0ABR9QX87_9FIRM|nr:ATP-binding protein [Gallibacter intestinalis]MBE5035495.1 ATP-binding protein [Gallibacter intestinalis]